MNAPSEEFLITVAEVMRAQSENIHDWHNGGDVIDSPLSRWILLPKDNTSAGQLDTRVLYLLEWRIEQADRILESITIRSDPEQMSTLFLLAVSGNTGRD